MVAEGESGDSLFLIVEGEARTVDVSSLGLDRFALGPVVPEHHVV